MRASLLAIGLGEAVIGPLLLVIGLTGVMAGLTAR